MRKILSLIPKEYQGGCVKVAFLVPVKAILDLVGVAALLPVMMLVLDPEKLHSSFLGNVYASLNFSSETNFAVFVIISVIAVILFKMVLSLLIKRYESRFLMSLYRNLSSRLFTSLYSRGLMYIKNQNSARMTFNVIGVCYNFVLGYLGGIMSIIGEVFFVVILLVSLFIYSSKATLMAVCAFIPALVLYVLCVRKPLKDMGKKTNDMRREQNRLLNEAFKGYSEVQVNDAFPIIKTRFVKGLEKIADYRVRIGIIQSLPSYALELSVVLVVAVMMLFQFRTDSPSDVMFLGVFSVALLKLLPALRGISSSMSALSSTAYTREIIKEINEPAQYKAGDVSDASPMQFEQSISVENLSFGFPDDDTLLFQNLSFEIRKGDRFGIKGRTGCGKTTLFNILLGLYLPEDGSVKVDGVELDRENVASWHKIIGYVPQDVFVADTTLIENVALGYDKDEIDKQKAMSALASASLMDFINSLPDGVNTRIGEAGCRLSGGQRQRLGIARALYKDASVLFFDEATSSLDAQTEMEVNAAIGKLSDSRRDITIIVISHRDSTMSFCDRILEL